MDNVWIEAAIVTVGALIFAGLVLLALFDFLEPEKVRDDYSPCNGRWAEAYIERCDCGLRKVPQQPVNTYSNLAYFAAGLFIVMVVQTAPAVVFALTMMYLSVGSSLYHATSTKWAGMLDVTAIHTVFSSTAAYALFTMLGYIDGAWGSLVMFLIAGLAAFILSKRMKSNLHLLVAIYLVVTYGMVVARMAYRGDWHPLPWVLGSLGAFAVGFAAWNLDRVKSFPLGRWGHGVWHVLTAVASALIFYATQMVSEAQAERRQGPGEVQEFAWHAPGPEIRWEAHPGR